MKTHTQKSPAKHETLTAAFVIIALVFVFTLIIYNSITYKVGF